MNDFFNWWRRGLAAVRDIKKGELILSVPKGALMTSQNLMMNDEAFSIAVKNHPYLCSTQVIFLFNMEYMNLNLRFALFWTRGRNFMFLEFYMIT